MYLDQYGRTCATFRLELLFDWEKTEHFTAVNGKLVPMEAQGLMSEEVNASLAELIDLLEKIKAEREKECSPTPSDPPRAGNAQGAGAEAVGC